MQYGYRNGEIASIITHFLIIFPLFSLFLGDPRTNYLYILFTILMGTQSTLFHFCLYSGGRLCLYPQAVLAILDHISAEGMVIMVITSLCFFKKIWMEYSFFLILVFINAIMKGLIDSQIPIWIFALIMSPFVCFRIYQQNVNMFLITISLILGFIGLLAYYMDERSYDVTHAVWHSMIFISLGLIFLAKAYARKR